MTPFLSDRPALLMFTVAFAGILTAVGCGGSDGPARYHVSGTVKFDGQLVPRGTVNFMPDVSKGTNGPSGSVKIVDGKYDTHVEGSLLPIAGELIVQVDGFGPEIPNEEFAKPLFRSYKTSLSMPAKAQVFDIDIPKGK